MGFHVRPVQRFATMARMFQADVEVQLRGRAVPGKSVINLVSLGGRCGDKMRIAAEGDDARQCVGVLAYLAENSFFVEDDVDAENRPGRHLERLARMASCFESDIRITVDGQTADAKNLDSLRRLGFGPDEVAQFDVTGQDAEQARALMENLAASCFYVEELMAARARKAARQ